MDILIVMRDTLTLELVKALCCCLVSESCPTLCDPMDCSLPSSSVHGTFTAKILEWVAISFSRESSLPRDRTHVSSLAGRFFTIEPPGKPNKTSWREVAQSCLTLWDPMDCSPPGSLAHGIFQAWIPGWVATSSSRGSYWPRDQIWVAHIAGRCFTIWATRNAHQKPHR